MAREYLAWVGGVPAPTTLTRPGDSQKDGEPAPTAPARTSPKKTAATAA